MAVTANLNNGPRSLRDSKSLWMLSGAGSWRRRKGSIKTKMPRLSAFSERFGVSAVNAAGWAIVTTANAHSFAQRCGVGLEAIRWSATESNRRGTERNSIADYLQLWHDVYSLGLGPLVPLTMLCNDNVIDANEMVGLLQEGQTVQLYGSSGPASRIC